MFGGQLIMTLISCVRWTVLSADDDIFTWYRINGGKVRKIPKGLSATGVPQMVGEPLSTPVCMEWFSPVNITAHLSHNGEGRVKITATKASCMGNGPDWVPDPGKLLP